MFVRKVLKFFKAGSDISQLLQFKRKTTNHFTVLADQLQHLNRKCLRWVSLLRYKQLYDETFQKTIISCFQIPKDILYVIEDDVYLQLIVSSSHAYDAL